MTTDDGAESRGAASRLVAAATLLVLLLLPAVGAYFVVGEPAAMGAVIGGLTGFLTSMTSGMSVARRFIPVVLAAVGAAVLTYDTWWWVLGLGVIGGMAGWWYRGPYYTPLVLAGLGFSIAQPVDGSTALVAAGFFLVIGAANGVVLAHALGAQQTVEAVVREAPPPPWTAAVLGVTAAAAGAAAAVWDDPNRYWLPMTVFILAMPRPGADLRARSRARVLGTALGVLGGGVVVQLGLPVGVPLLLAVAALLVALTTPSMTVAAAGSAAAIVMLLSPSGGGLEVAESRLAATVAAVVIAALVVAIVHWAASRLSRYTESGRIEQRVQDLAGEQA